MQAEEKVDRNGTNLFGSEIDSTWPSTDLYGANHLEAATFVQFFSTVKKKTKFNPSCRNVLFAVPDKSPREIFN